MANSFSSSCWSVLLPLVSVSTRAAASDACVVAVAVKAAARVEVVVEVVVVVVLVVVDPRLKGWRAICGRD